MRRRLVGVLMMAACLGNAQAQLHLKANVQNNHLWRGMEVSDGIVLLTDLSYTMVNDHVTVGLWGGCNSEGSYKEFNHYLNLKAGGWGLALWDTYNFSPGATYNNKEYWNYSAHTTGRFLDATLSYRFQKEKFPLLLNWSTVVFGRDRNSDNTEQKYSTFVYAEYPVYQKDGWKVDAGVGGAFALNRAGEDAHFFGTTAGIAASIPRPQTRQLHHTSICQGYVESTEQPELFPDWSRSHPLLNLQCYRKNIITII